MIKHMMPLCENYGNMAFPIACDESQPIVLTWNASKACHNCCDLLPTIGTCFSHMKEMKRLILTKMRGDGVITFGGFRWKGAMMYINNVYEVSPPSQNCAS